MFAKPYRPKSVNTLKNSEKKHLAQRIKDEFPAVSEEKIKELVPVKSSTSFMKLVVHSGATVGVYVVDGVPMLLEVNDALVPTVCALWKAPEMVSTIIIQAAVMQKVIEGAPLYLPGVIVPPGGVGFPLFPQKALLALTPHNNAARAAIGRAALSSADMLMKTGGACLDVIHTVGDQLCREPKFNKIEWPRMGPASYTTGFGVMQLADGLDQLRLQSPREEWPALGAPPAAPAPAGPCAGAPPAAPVPAGPCAAPADGDVASPDSPDDTGATDTSLADDSTLEDSIPVDMDGLLKWCLLSFLKLEGKHVELPLKTNLLYKNHLIPLCPPDRTLDVKKSTYKKMGKFLEAMQREGLVEVREIERGVDAVTKADVTHPLVRGHRVADHVRDHHSTRNAPPEREYEPPVVRELYCVTAHVLPLFGDVRKGTGLSPAEVRAALTQYVKSKELLSSQQRGRVVLDATLANIVGKPEQEAAGWEVVMAGVTGRMTPATEMRFADGTVRLTKSKLDPIKFQVASRAGNKKVTLVSNLEQFGFHLPQLARCCQLGVGASCGVTRSPGAAADQLLLQGDQTHFMAKLLIEKYGLPKKFVEGADKALNKKK